MTNQKLAETFLSIINPGIKIVERYADEMKQVRAPKPPLGNSKSKKFLKLHKQFQEELKKWEEKSARSLPRYANHHGYSKYGACHNFFGGGFVENQPDFYSEEGVPAGWIQYNGCCASGGEFNLITAYQDLDWIEIDGEKVPPVGILAMKAYATDEDYHELIRICAKAREFCKTEIEKILNGE